MSVNLSARQLAHPGIVDDVAAALEASGLPPARLWLELTETALFEEADAPLPVLHELKALGVQLVLDDFGTGYSSLAYLQRFPLDALKIDRAFVAEMTQDPRAAALVEAITTMARSLGLTVVPEGIETEAQREALLALGCRYGQGYLFGRPQPPSALPGARRRGLEPRGGERGRDRRVAAEHRVGDEARRAGAERDAPRAVAGGHEQALGRGQRAEQRAPVGADRAGAGAQRDRLGAGELGHEAAAALDERGRDLGRLGLLGQERRAERGDAPARDEAEQRAERVRRSCRSLIPPSSSEWRGGWLSRSSTLTPHSGATGRQAPVGSTSAELHGPAATTTAPAGSVSPVGGADAGDAPVRRHRRDGGAFDDLGARGAGAGGERLRGGGGRDGAAGVDAGSRRGPRRAPARSRAGASSASARSSGKRAARSARVGSSAAGSSPTTSTPTVSSGISKPWPSSR